MSNFHVHSDYSVRDSIQSVSKIIQFQLDNGKDWFAITDHGTLASLNESMDLVGKLRKDGIDIRYFPGCEFYLKPDKNDDGKENIPRLTELKTISKRKTEDYPGQKEEVKKEYDSIINNPLHNLSYYHITVLAYNQKGLQNLYNINNNGDFYYKHRVTMEDIMKYNEGLIILTGCPAGYMYVNVENGFENRAKKWLKNLKSIFKDRVYFELMFHDGVAELERKDYETDAQYYQRRVDYELNIYNRCLKIARDVGVKVVGTNDSHYTNPKDRRFWEFTRKAMLSNSKYDLSVGNYHMMKDNSMFERVYGIPQSELDEAEDEIVSRLESDIKLPHSVYKSTHKDREMLERMVWTGFKNKRLGTPEEKDSLLKIPYELAVIQTKGFDKYFLMVKNVVKAAFERGVLVGPGRGSGAGSEVTYLIDITKTDPIKYGLMFERFLNPGRNAMPDIDLDLESFACSNFDPTDEFYKDIELMFAREQVTDEEIDQYWDMWRRLKDEVGDTRRKEIFEQSENATYFEGPIWKQPEDIIIVKDR